MRARASKIYAHESRQVMEERLIVNYLPLVRHVVRKVAGTSMIDADLEDLISAGTVGLVKAARKFDQSKEVDFKTYAYIRIRGAVIDELRTSSHVPVAVHKQIKSVKEAYNIFVAATGRPPSDEELAQKCDLSVEQLYKILQEDRRKSLLSIHGIREDSADASAFAPVDQGPSPDAVAEKKDTLANLAAAIAELPERDRIVILLYYERDLTMKEAAKVLEVTESRVSQIHASAVFKLSMKMERA